MIINILYSYFYAFIVPLVKIMFFLELKKNNNYLILKFQKSCKNNIELSYTFHPGTQEINSVKLLQYVI